MMRNDWNEDQPIYRQLRDKVIALIISGTYAEREAVPSVRKVSGDLGINHLTVAKAYQELVDDGLLEKKRGLGMFVIEGARHVIIKREKERFIEQELPAFCDRLAQLDISTEEIVASIKQLIKENK